MKWFAVFLIVLQVLRLAIDLLTGSPFNVDLLTIASLSAIIWTENQ